MKVPWTNLEEPAKVLLTSIAFLLVAAGLCGVQFLIIKGASGQGQWLGPVFMITGLIELGVILVAGLTAAGALLTWISTAIYIRFTDSRGNRNEIQKLLDRSDKDDLSR